MDKWMEIKTKNTHNIQVMTKAKGSALRMLRFGHAMLSNAGYILQMAI